MVRFAFWLALCASAVATVPALAQPAYPTRNVEIIVSYGPGGSTDIIARIVAQKLQERLGQSFVVLNRPGAGGTIGMTAAMRAAPDGHTLYNKLHGGGGDRAADFQGREILDRRRF